MEEKVKSTGKKNRRLKNLKQNGLVITEDLKEQLEVDSAATSKAHVYVRTLVSTEAASFKSCTRNLCCIRRNCVRKSAEGQRF